MATPWKEYQTAEGSTFYYNERTGKTQWDKPIELYVCNADIREDDQWYWVKHKTLCYIPARRVRNSESTKDNCQRFECDGRTFELKMADVGPRIDCVDEIFSDNDDMINLSRISEASVIQNIRTRFHKDKFETRIGERNLVRINPYKEVQYETRGTEAVSDAEVEFTNNEMLFSLVKRAYKSAIISQRNQG